MHDREFTKPQPIRLAGPPGQPDLEYKFEHYVGEFVWSYGKWNEEDSWGDAQIRLGEAIEEANPGEPVKMSLDDWEKFREANKEAKIQGPLAHKIRKHQKAVKSAHKPEQTS